jgi:hypothetical protein
MLNTMKFPSTTKQQPENELSTGCSLESGCGVTEKSGELTVDFLRQVSPYAIVISSVDNENYSHPGADAFGSAGKYSRGDKPKVYSTELARSINSAGKILYGMINLRSDGKKIYMAQLKEKRSGADIWDSYEIK